jgi:dephospho-CoA kinase
MARKVIGLFGLIGSGKDVVSEYLCSKHGYTAVHMGDIVREISTNMGRTVNRDDLTITQKECVEKYGIDYFATKVIEKIIKNDLQKVVINGIRRPEDVVTPKKAFGKEMVFVLIDVPQKIRFERMKKRAREGDPKTLKEFQHQEESESKNFNLDETIRLTEHKISNKGTLEDLYEHVEDFLIKTGF